MIQANNKVFFTGKKIMQKYYENHTKNKVFLFFEFAYNSKHVF